MHFTINSSVSFLSFSFLYSVPWNLINRILERRVQGLSISVWFDSISPESIVQIGSQCDRLPKRKYELTDSLLAASKIISTRTDLCKPKTRSYNNQVPLSDAFVPFNPSPPLTFMTGIPRPGRRHRTVAPICQPRAI